MVSTTIEEDPVITFINDESEMSSDARDVYNLLISLPITSVDNIIATTSTATTSTATTSMTSNDIQ